MFQAVFQFFAATAAAAAAAGEAGGKDAAPAAPGACAAFPKGLHSVPPPQSAAAPPPTGFSYPDGPPRSFPESLAPVLAPSICQQRARPLSPARAAQYRHRSSDAIRCRLRCHASRGSRRLRRPLSLRRHAARGRRCTDLVRGGPWRASPHAGVCGRIGFAFPRGAR